MSRLPSHALFAVLVAILAGCPGPGPGPDGGSGNDGGTGSDAGNYGLLGSRYDGRGRALLKMGDKLVAIGQGALRGDSRGPDALAVRTDLELRLDSTFNGNGIALLDFDGGPGVTADGGAAFAFNEDAAFAALADQDKVVLAGYARGPLATPGGAVMLARLNADGTRDTTFNSVGHAIIDFDPASHVNGLAAAHALAKTSDNKYLVAGAGPGGVFVFRVNRDGSLDNTFSTGALLNLGGGENEAGLDLIVQGDKVLVGGGGGFAIGRLTSAGMLDTTFGTSGVARSTGGLQLKMLARADGRILAIGIRAINVGMSDERAVLKLFQITADGTPDPSFGVAGVVEIDVTATERPAGDVRGAAFTADGSLILYSINIAGHHLWKLTAAGAIDTSFGSAGRKTVPFNANLLGLLTSQAHGAHSLVLDGNTAYVTNYTTEEVRPGRFEGLFAMAKLSL